MESTLILIGEGNTKIIYSGVRALRMPEDVWKSRCVTVTGDEEESGSKL